MKKYLTLLSFVFVSFCYAQVAPANGAISDTTLFKALNLDYPGMSTVKADVIAGNYKQAKADYLAFRRAKANYWTPLIGTISPNPTYSNTPNADLLSNNTFGTNISAFDPTDTCFGPDASKINWYYYYNIQPEWTHIFNRFTFWNVLDTAYWSTRNETYAKAWINQMCSWVAKNPVDLDTAAEVSICQRSLEMGNRMADTWNPALLYFINSTSFVDTAMGSFTKGILAHGWRMDTCTLKFINSNQIPSNHELLLASGLAIAAMTWPEFIDAAKWQTDAFVLLNTCLTKTIYADGVEVELSPGYHNWCRDYLMNVAQIANINNVQLPTNFLTTLKKMYYFDVYIQQPSGLVPPTNDNSDATYDSLGAAAAYWPTDSIFQFFTSNGTIGKAPDTLSYRFPYAGFNVMRSGWDNNANYLFFKNGPIGYYVHGHEDDLSLYLTCFGQPLLVEDGGWRYDGTQNMYYTRVTSAHNTITVDRKGQHRIDDSASGPQKLSALPSIQPWISNNVADYTCGIYNDGYQTESYVPNYHGFENARLWTGTKDYSVTHKRHVIFLKPYYYVVADFLEGSGKHRFDNYFQLNTPSVAINKYNLSVNSLTPPSSGSINTPQLLLSPMDTSGLSVSTVQGQTSPSYQGWEAFTDYVIQPIPSVIYSKTQTAPASFSTFLYPYNTTATPVVSTTLLANCGVGIWASSATTQYEKFSIAIRRYDSLNGTMQMNTPYTFTANAGVAISRQALGSNDKRTCFSSLSSYSDSTTSFTANSANLLVYKTSSNLFYLQNNNDSTATITVTNPIHQTYTIPRGQWIQIAASVITAISAPTISISPTYNTGLVAGDTVAITATVTNVQVPINNVSFYDGPVLLGVDSIAPYTFNWSGAATGFHLLSAKVTNQLGQSSTSAISKVSMGIIEAEDYSVNSSGTIAVDTSRSNDSIVKNIAANGYLQYNFSTTRSGKYSLSITLLNNVAANTITVTIDGVAITNNGVAIGNISVPVAAAYQTIYISALDISTTSAHTIKIIFNNALAAIDFFQLGYTTYYPVPGLIQAKNFSQTGNLSSSANNKSVIVLNNPESAGGGTYISNIDSNWVTYGINVATAGSYFMQLSMCNPWITSPNKNVGIYYNDTILTTALFPTGTYTNFYLSNVTPSFAHAGLQTLKLKLNCVGDTNYLAWINFAPRGMFAKINSPVNGYAPTTNSVLIVASAKATGGVSKVGFFLGDSLMGYSLTADSIVSGTSYYHFLWPNAPSGSARITSVTYDVYGNAFYANPITINPINKLPTVSISMPTSAGFPMTIMPNCNYNITANAGDSDGTISNLAFYNNQNIWLATDNYYPYNCNFYGTQDSIYSITAFTKDNMGGSTTSNPIILTAGTILPQNYTAQTGTALAACSYSKSGQIIKLTDSVNNSLQYLVDIANAGRYMLEMSATNRIAGRKVQWLVDGLPATLDSIPLSPYTLPTSKLSNSSFVWLSPFDLSSGVHTITFKFSGNLDTLNYFKLVNLNYQEIPGAIAATSFFEYGSDTIPTNPLNPSRFYTDYNGVVGVTVDSLDKNWLAYAVNVDSAGTYRMIMRISNKFLNTPYLTGTNNYGAPLVTIKRVDVLVDSAYQLSVTIPSRTFLNNTAFGFNNDTATINFTTPGKHILKFYFYGTYTSIDSITFNLIKSLPPSLTVWNGAYDTLWNNANNWNNGLPSAGTSAIIPNISTMPTVNNSQSVNDLIIYNKAAVLNAGTLNVWDSLYNNGLIYGSGAVNLVGTSSQIILGNGTISNLTLNNSYGATIASGNNSLNITSTLNLLAGTLNTNGNLILRSNALATASITPIASGASITGNITVQRHIPAKAARRYSFISSPVSQQINNAWQQQIFITGSGSGGQVCGSVNSNGFDVTPTNKSSLFQYSPTKINGSHWVSISNTNATNLTPGIGYSVNVRGSRTNGGGCYNQLNSASPTSPDAVVLSATGAYNTSPTAAIYGTTSYGNATRAFTLLGNPYPAALSASSFLNSNNSILTYNMWLYASNGNNTGGYGSWNKANKVSTGYWPSDYVSDNSTDLVIPSGSAFFVERTAATDATVSFAESQKMSTPKNGVSIFGTTTNSVWNNKVRITLENSDSTFFDDAVVLLGNDPNISDTAYTVFDTYSMNTGNTKFIASSKNGLLLSVNTIKTPILADSVLLNVHSSSTGNLLLRFSDVELFDGNISINLWDKLLNKVVDVKTNPYYKFLVTSDTNSRGINRFELIFNKANTMGINQIFLKATDEKGVVDLAWKTSHSESDRFAVEASMDGKVFRNIGFAQGIDSLSRYTFCFVRNLFEESFYRIKDIDKKGNIMYSNVVFVPDYFKKPGIIVYPNPLVGKLFCIYIKGLTTGNYKVVLYDLLGREFDQFPIYHDGTNKKYNLIMKNKLAAGSYRLVIQNKSSEQIISESAVEIQ